MDPEFGWFMKCGSWWRFQVRENGRPMVRGEWTERPQGRKGEVVAPSGPQSLLSRRKPSSSSAAVPPNPAPPPPRRTDDLPFWQQTWFLVLLLLMGLFFFALSLFLYLGLDVDVGSAATAASTARDDGVQITYGSVVKLMHERTKFRLHSHDVPYGSGSGQQSVTGFPNVDDSNSYWIVRPQPDSSAKQGDVIKSGTIIRLQHMRTRKWLHSHLHASPITGNLEKILVEGQ
ncbi:Stromal cell-derived factor 2-like protein [Acorus gramineus]|uniref:Stromal cell-derived factor 2-like protein n=1 Tax=Acorus gramineus TaxID=55184 RepID=A0AAV9AZZ1_ACOGR|nr:Stromal cell-derived factor 2-like protein [Acorus gramineus]